MLARINSELHIYVGNTLLSGGNKTNNFITRELPILWHNIIERFLTKEWVICFFGGHQIMSRHPADAHRLTV